MVGADDTKWVQRLIASGEPTYEELASFVASEYQYPDWPNLPSIQSPVWESCDCPWQGYNLERLHSVNEDLSPVEFENSQVKVSSLG